MIIKYPEENILCVEDFLSEHELSMLMKECLSDGEESWWHLDKENTFNGKTKKIIQDESLEVMKSVYKKVNSILNYPKYEMDQFLQFNRYFPEDIENCLDDHYDSETNSIYKGGVVIYLNEDFEGGTLEYTNLNITIVPKAGMMVAHPGNEKYMHKVNKIKSGYRYSILGLIKAFSEEADQYTKINHIV
jgi:hypothetical protein